MINSVVVTGRLTKDVDLKMSGNGKYYCNFTIAVNRTIPGDGQKNTDFFWVSCFNKTAENLSRFTSKGSLIGVEGRLQQQEFQDQNTGKTTSKTQIIADKITFLSTNNQKQSNYNDTTEMIVNNNFNNNFNNMQQTKQQEMDLGFIGRNFNKNNMFDTNFDDFDISGINNPFEEK